MKEISLTQGKVALVDDEDYEFLSKFKWTTHSMGYAYRAVRRTPDPRQSILMHRAVMEQMLGGPIPDGLLIDHRDANRLNNQRANLRLVTWSQNHMNRRKGKGSSQYKGVVWYKPSGKWVASLDKDKRTYFLGYHQDESEAARAYDKAAREHFGEFARLNFPDE